jgi:hypothetical protein
MEFSEAVKFLMVNGFPEDHADLVVHCAQAGGEVAVLRDSLRWEVFHQNGLYRITVG